MIDKKSVGHLRRLVKTWFDRRFISKEQFKVFKEDIETFIRLESK